MATGSETGARRRQRRCLRTGGADSCRRPRTAADPHQRGSSARRSRRNFARSMKTAGPRSLSSRSGSNFFASAAGLRTRCLLLDQGVEHAGAWRCNLDEREAAHQRERHLEQQRLVEDVHRRQHSPRLRDLEHVSVGKRARHAFGNEHERLAGAGLGSVIGQHDGLTGEDREELAERAVEVRAIQLVNHQPLVRPDRLEEMALLRSPAC